MKKFIIGLFVLALLIAPVLASQGENLAKIKTWTENTRCNMQILVLSLALFANDHNGKYPTPSQFYSKKFDYYIYKTLGKKVKDTDKYYRAYPHRWIKYTTSKDRKSYCLKYPYPYILKLKKFMFCLEKGFVIEANYMVK